MGWDRGRYYTRSRRENGCVIREYVGAGPVGKLAAKLDAIARQDRAFDRLCRQVEREELLGVPDELGRLNDLADVLTRAALLAAGYRQHHRGEWRRRRDHRENLADNDRADD